MRLPAVMDTLEALRFARRLQESASQSRHVTVDASVVEEIGFAGLQLLALVAAGLTQAGGTLSIEAPPTAVRARIADAGLEGLLLNGAAAEPGPRDMSVSRSLRFTDAALDYGREPADALRRLREADIGVTPVLPDPLPPIGSIEADRILIRFDITLRDEDLPALNAALAEFGGDALIDAASPPLRPVATTGGPEPEASPPIDTQRLKIERVMGDVEELLTRHAAIEFRAPTFDRELAAELKAMGILLRSLQDHAMAAGLMPIGTLLRMGMASAATSIPAFRGAEIEIEPAVIEPLLPWLRGPGHAEASGLAAREAEGAVQIEMPWRAGEEMPDGLGKAAASVRGRAAIVVSENGPLLRLELPRSRSMIEALIVRAGNLLAALPVDRTIEILRPDAADVTLIGDDTELMRFRDAYLPVIDLRAALGEAAPGTAADAEIVVMMQSPTGDFGIRVGEVTDHRQIMVKPVGQGLTVAAGVVGFSFSAGGIALVLDVETLRAAAIGRSGS